MVYSMMICVVIPCFLIWTFGILFTGCLSQLNGLRICWYTSFPLMVSANQNSDFQIFGFALVSMKATGMSSLSFTMSFCSSLLELVC